jgi:hypothetical protein
MHVHGHSSLSNILKTAFRMLAVLASSGEIIQSNQLAALDKANLSQRLSFFQSSQLIRL